MYGFPQLAHPEIAIQERYPNEYGVPSESNNSQKHRGTNNLHRAGNAFCESVDRVNRHAEGQLYPYAWRTRPLPARSKDHHDVDYLRLLLSFVRGICGWVEFPVARQVLDRDGVPQRGATVIVLYFPPWV